jgi:hypothetical protein
VIISTAATITRAVLSIARSCPQEICAELSPIADQHLDVLETLNWVQETSGWLIDVKRNVADMMKTSQVTRAGIVLCFAMITSVTGKMQRSITGKLLLKAAVHAVAKFCASSAVGISCSVPSFDSGASTGF